MTRQYIQIALLGIVLAIVGVRPAFAQDEPRISLSTSVDYSVGDYGTGKDTTLLYVPFTLGVRPFDRFWLSVTVPYLYQTSQNVVLTGGGVAVRGKSNGKLTRSTTSTTESGLGDVLAKASLVLVEEKDFIPEITPYFKVKFPTADKDRGLGTGEFDETLGVDASKLLIGRLFGYLELAYTFIGEPSGTTLHNSFSWSVGAAYTIVQPFSVFASLEGATAIAPGQDDPLDIRVGAEYRIIQALKLTGAVTPRVVERVGGLGRLGNPHASFLNDSPEGRGRGTTGAHGTKRTTNGTGANARIAALCTKGEAARQDS